VIEDFDRNYQKPWITAYGWPNKVDPFGFKCLHCGQSDILPSDISINDYCHRAAAFAVAHKNCPPK